MQGRLVLAILALSVGFHSGLVAQARQPLVGIVVGADGKPLPDAKVTLVEDNVDLVGIDPVDVVHVTTDARGRFVAMALPAVRYAGFAVGAEGKGAAPVAPPVPDLACGRRNELKAVATGHARTVRLKGLAAWGKPAELHVRLSWAHCAGHVVDLAIDDAHQVRVPCSSAVGTAMLVDRDGHEIADVMLSADASPTARIHAPVPLEVRVVDEQGKSVAGADVSIEFQERGYRFLDVDGHRHVIRATATSDAKGVVRLSCQAWRHPLRGGANEVVVTARKAGYHEGASGRLSDSPFRGWEILSKAPENVTWLQIPLVANDKAGAAQADEIRASAPWRGRSAKLFAMATAEQVKGPVTIRQWVPRTYRVDIDAQGKLSVPPLSPTSEAVVLRLPPVEGVPVLMLPTRAPALPSVDLEDCGKLSLQLLTETGGPASDASVMIVPHDATELSFRHVTPLVPDQAGRLKVFVQRGGWTLLAMNETSWLGIELDENSAAKPMRLQLEPKSSRRVTVVDDSGEPVSGAMFAVNGFQRVGRSPVGLLTVLDHLQWSSVARHLRGMKTDARGEATLRWLPTEGPPSFYAYRGSRRVRSESTLLEEGDAPLRIRIE